jgi:hypothetical protein
MTMRETGGVYAVITLSLTLIDSSTSSTPSPRSTRSISADKWVQERLLYQRIDHLNQEYIRQLPEVVKQDFRIRFSKKGFCETCVIAKQRRILSKEPAERAKRPGQRIHANLYRGGYTFTSKELQQSAEFKELLTSEGGC